MPGVEPMNYLNGRHQPSKRLTRNGANCWGIGRWQTNARSERGCTNLQVKRVATKRSLDGPINRRQFKAPPLTLDGVTIPRLSAGLPYQSKAGLSLEARAAWATMTKGKCTRLPAARRLTSNWSTGCAVT